MTTTPYMTGSHGPDSGNRPARHGQHGTGQSANSRQRLVAGWIVDLVEAHFGLAPGTLSAKRLKPPALRLPRDLAAYLLVTWHGESARAAGRRLGCHRSTVTTNVRRVEAGRDDPVIDAHLLALESALERIRGAVGIDTEAGAAA